MKAKKECPAIPDLVQGLRKAELRNICDFIDSSNSYELGIIIDHIKCSHDNIMVFNHQTKLLAKVDGVSINGDCIQLNIESENKRG